MPKRPDRSNALSMTSGRFAVAIQVTGTLRSPNPSIVEINAAQRDLMRLSLRLGIKPSRAKAIPQHHAPQLLDFIDQLEDEEKAELEALVPENPTVIPLIES